MTRPGPLLPRFALMLSLLATPLAAQTFEHGNIRYAAPQGWKEGRVSKTGVKIWRADRGMRRCRSCQLQLAASTAGAADPLSFLAQNGGIFSGPRDGAPELMTGPEPLDLGTRRAAVAGYRLDNGDLQILLAVALADRTEVFGLTGPADKPEALAEVLAAFERDLLPLVQAADYRSEQPDRLAPAVPGERSGLWRGWQTDWTIGLDGMMHSQTKLTLYSFWPDGHFTQGLPATGLAPFSSGAGAMVEWGRYSDQDGMLQLTYSDGRSLELPHGQGSGFACGSASCEQVRALPDGARIEGSLRDVFFSGLGAGAAGAISSSTTTQFLADGTWQQISGRSGQGEDLTAVTKNAAQGSYRIEDGLLIRSPSNGGAESRDPVFFDAERIVIGAGFLEGGLAD